MRLIDADALKEKLRELWVEKLQMPMEDDLFLTFVMCDIDNTPTIDAEPVVRCKECIYYRPADVICEIFNDSTGLSKLVQPDDYCSYGERREP